MLSHALQSNQSMAARTLLVSASVLCQENQFNFILAILHGTNNCLHAAELEILILRSNFGSI